MSWQIPAQVWDIAVPLSVAAGAWLGVLITAFTLPGIWFMLLIAGLGQWWSISMRGADQAMFSWWTIGVCVVIAILAEIVEGVASAFGAAKAGGSKKAAFASIGGALVGALVGTFAIPIPIVGTVLGAAIGAGGAALLTEKHLGKKTWEQSSRVGAGAAIGRLLATMAKVAFAAIVATILSLAAFT